MFVHDYSSTLSDTDGDGIGDSGMPVEVRANTTIGFVSGERFRSDEQPLKLDFKVHYSADYNRGIFDNRLPYAPVSFTISDPGPQFGNITHPTVYDGYGNGYRADAGAGFHWLTTNPWMYGNRSSGTHCSIMDRAYRQADMRR